MRDDERRKRRDDDPDEPEGLFDFEDENAEDISELKRLFGSEASDEELGPPIRFEQGRELEVRIAGLYERYEDGQPCWYSYAIISGAMCQSSSVLLKPMQLRWRSAVRYHSVR